MRSSRCARCGRWIAHVEGPQLTLFWHFCVCCPCAQDALLLVLRRTCAYIDHVEGLRPAAGFAAAQASRDCLAAVRMAIVARQGSAVGLADPASVSASASAGTEGAPQGGGAGGGGADGGEQLPGSQDGDSDGAPPPPPPPSWEPDDEPAAPNVDTWGRGAVPSVAPPPPAAAAELSATTSAHVGTGASARAYTSSPSVLSAGGDRAGSTYAASERGTGRGTPAASKGRRGSLAAAKAEVQAHAAAAAAVAAHRPKAQQLSVEDQEREQRLRDEIEQRRAAEELKRQQAEKDAAEVARIDTLQKELRGQDYIYDHNGEVVVMAARDPDRLPAFSVGPKVSVHSGTAGAGDLPGRAGGRSPRKGGRGGTMRRTAGATGGTRGAGSGSPTPVVLIQNATAGQPSLMETMTVARGVTLKEGSSAKPGPPVAGAEGHMSRREYERMMGVSGGAGGAMVQRQHGQSFGSGSARRAGNAGPLASVPDVAPAPLEPRPPPAAAAAPQPLPDVNDELVRAPDWGQNVPVRDRPYRPAPNPPKVTPQERERVTGKTSVPRERPGVAHRAMGSAVAAPAGHGFVPATLPHPAELAPSPQATNRTLLAPMRG